MCWIQLAQDDPFNQTFPLPFMREICLAYRLSALQKEFCCPEKVRYLPDDEGVGAARTVSEGVGDVTFLTGVGRKLQIYLRAV
jgi:hypothetical protein